jgi:hypothetical protein
VATIPAEEVTDAAYASLDLLTCAAMSCATECSAGSISGIGGSSSAGGGSSSVGGGSGVGGMAAVGGGASTGGGTGLSQGQLFSGTGVSINAPDYGAVGNFFVLEDSVADGALVSDSLSHSDLDPPESNAEPSSFESSTAPCVSGTIAVVTDADGANCEVNDSDCVWGDLWGGGIGLTLNEEGSTAAAWDASAVGVTGFEFSLSGSVDGVPIRFFVEDTSGNQFCTEIVTGKNSIPFSSLAHECWSPTTLSLDPTKIKQVSWQFVPDASYSYVISNFCVEDLSVLD